MFKTFKTKLITGMMALASVFATAGVGVTIANADVSGNNNPSVAQNAKAPFTQGRQESEAYSIEIVSKNLSYSDSIYILYAVDYAGFDESQNEVKMLFWDSAQTEYTVATAQSVKNSNAVATIGGRQCIVFYSDGIAAKEMNDNIYCRAYATVDGETIYSAVEKYSVVDYVYDKRAGGNLSSNQTAIFADMLDYGSSAQRLFNYNTDTLANATYYTVTLENGTLEDGFVWGRYVVNATATITANPPADGYEFLSWVDETGATVAETKTVSVAVTANKTYTAIYGEISNATPASAFRYTSDGSAITITKYIGDYTDVVIPSTIDGLPVTTIGDNAFEYCDVLTSIEISKGVMVIGSEAFTWCTNLQSITIPKTVTAIGDDVFVRSYSLSEIIVDKGNPSYKDIDGNLYTKDGSVLIQYAVGKTETEFLIPEGVVEIGRYAFGASKLSSIHIPNTVTRILMGAFTLSVDLTNIEIPDSVTYIEWGAFRECSGLVSVALSKSLTEISMWMFMDCTSLEDIAIPNSVTYISSEAFANCVALKGIVIPGSVERTAGYVFSNCDNLTIYCEAESKPDGWNANWNSSNCPVVWGYKPATPATAFEYTSDGSAITITKYIGDYTDVVIPSTIDGLPVTTIGILAFSECSSLMSVVIPNSVTSIWDSAFRECSSLMSVVIPNSVTSIWDSMFYGCSSLTSVDIPNSVTSIGYSAFDGCSSLTSVVIPDGVTYIGYGAFSNCESLTSIVIPDSVTSIGDVMFYGCSSLTSIVIPDSVTHIDSYAFYGCNNLTIYCEAKSQPSGWGSDWNSSNRPVIWGYTGEVITYTFTYPDGTVKTISSQWAIEVPYEEDNDNLWFFWGPEGMTHNPNYAIRPGSRIYGTTYTSWYGFWMTVGSEPN